MQKTTIISILRYVVHPVTVLYFRLICRVRDIAFWWNTPEQKYRPSRLWLPILISYKFTRALAFAWKREKTEYALKLFDGVSRKHYSEKGPGYDGYAEFSDEQCLETYNKMEGRLSLFYKINPDIFGFIDGDTFLDVGCGMGQNIKALAQYYPSSKIEGVDVNPDALRIIRIGARGNQNINVRQGDLTDLNFLSSFPDGSIDHLIISHVFAFIISSSVEKTQELRQSILDELIRISKKSFLLLDGGIFFDGEPEVEVESYTRCVYREPLEHYFHSYFENADAFFAIPMGETACFFLRKLTANNF